MNKWEDSVKKTLEHHDKECQCSTNRGLFVPNRQLSFIVAGLLFLFFCTFMTGYFIGKKKVVEQFTENLQQEAVADQIYTAVLATIPESENQTVATNYLTPTDARVTNNNEIEIEKEIAATSINQELLAEAVVLNLPETSAVRYYAQLIGFGTEKAAQLFVKKLATKGVDTEIKKRTSKTAQGKVSYWYQVITGTYNNKDDLSALVEKIAKEEKIKDISIRVC